MGSTLKVWLIFCSIFIFELQLCHIMASNTNKYINTNQWGEDIIWIHVELAIINNNPNLNLRYFITDFLAFITIKKEAINKIQIDLKSRNNALSSDKNFLFRELITCWSHFTTINKIKIDSKSRNDASSSDENFLFRKLITCWSHFTNIIMWPEKVAAPILMGHKKCSWPYLNGIWKNAAGPFLVQFFFQKSSRTEMDALRWAQEMIYELTDSMNLNNTHTHNPNQLAQGLFKRGRVS